MLPETHPRLKARCRGSSTLSTKVDDETKRWVERKAEQSEIPASELLRRLLDYYRANESVVDDEEGL
jgi:hypothetical protein